MTLDDVAGFLSGGTRSAKFPTPGTTVGGAIITEPVLRQQTDFDTGELLTWSDGKPRMQLVVTVQTEDLDPYDPSDDGVRTFYVKGEMQKAVADAVRRAKARTLEPGGTLTIRYTGDGEPVGRKNPPKLYAAKYEPPVAGVDAFLGTDKSAAADPWADTAAPAAPAAAGAGAKRGGSEPPF